MIREGLSERKSPIAFETQGGAGTARSRNSPRIGLIGNRFKLLTDFSEGGVEDLLYDLLEDPGESVNLATAHPDRVSAMKSTLRAWRESCRASESGDDYP